MPRTLDELVDTCMSLAMPRSMRAVHEPEPGSTFSLLRGADGLPARVEYMTVPGVRPHGCTGCVGELVACGVLPRCQSNVFIRNTPEALAAYLATRITHQEPT